VIITFLLNMYTNHRTHVLWIGRVSHWFNVSNGVKQGGVLSPILFCAYIDGLLISLCRAGLGCHIGDMFVGALACADDLVLSAPTPHAMRLMLQFCEEYAKDHDVLFNADKSKCIISCPRGVASIGNLNHDICFSRTISGNVTENAESWPHLDHVITNNASDNLDVLSRRGSFIGQVNNVICWFSKLDCCMKTRLLQASCFSFYGCELWDLSNLHVQSSCVAWRQALHETYLETAM